MLWSLLFCYTSKYFIIILFYLNMSQVFHENGFAHISSFVGLPFSVLYNYFILLIFEYSFEAYFRDVFNVWSHNRNRYRDKHSTFENITSVSQSALYYFDTPVYRLDRLLPVYNGSYYKSEWSRAAKWANKKKIFSIFTNN